MADASSLHAELRDLVGRVIADRYRIDEVIGVGGMGAVFRAHHLGLRRDVAVKVLHPDLGRDAEISARFDREAHSASRLDHPNCLQVTDFGSTDGGMKFMAMQLLQGAELSRSLGRKLAPEEAAELTIQILRGLEHAHEHGVIHRDLKPENIFVTTDHEGRRTLKLVDFGIAKIVEGGADDGMTRAGVIFGTPRYMSPEQATGMAIDTRTDLYSTGIILHQMLSGSVPFDGADPVTIVRMQVTSTPPPLPAETPTQLADFVARLLEKERDKRFACAKDARAALETILAHLRWVDGKSLAPRGAMEGMNPTLPAATPAPLTPAGPLDRRRRLRLAAIAGAVGFAAVLVLLTSGKRSGSPGASGSSPSITAGLLTPSPPADKLAEIDRLLLSNDLEGARKVLQPLRDEHPENAQLLWRQGRLFAKQRRRKSQALAAYGDAVEKDPELLEDRDFYAELWELLNERGLEEEALNLALRRMGKHGHKFLLGVVNRDKNPLAFQDRHRALDELAKDPQSAALVDTKLNTSLDLKQASGSLAPCTNYGAALSTIENEPHPDYAKVLSEVGVPAPAKSEDGSRDEKDAEACEGLDERRRKLLERLNALGPPSEVGSAKTASEPAASPAKSQDAAEGGASSSEEASEAEAAKSTTKSRKGSRCNKFGAALLYKECRR